MYIAMNRFTVKTQNSDAFDALWLGRDSHLKDMEGFVEFHMLRGPQDDDGETLFASHTVWTSEETFRAWTRSLVPVHLCPPPATEGTQVRPQI